MCFLQISCFHLIIEILTYLVAHYGPNKTAQGHRKGNGEGCFISLYLTKYRKQINKVCYKRFKVRHE